MPDSQTGGGMKTGTWLLGAAFFFALASAHAQNISDNDFRQWSFGAYGVGGVATASVVPPKGASPRRLKVSTLTLPGDSAFATAIKGDFVTSAALAGARFTMTLGVLGGDGAFGAGQAIALLLEQAGSLYALPVGETKVESSHAMLPFSGTLVAERFTRVAGGGTGAAGARWQSGHALRLRGGKLGQPRANAVLRQLCARSRRAAGGGEKPRRSPRSNRCPRSRTWRLRCSPR
jgi:hypothetical protein